MTTATDALPLTVENYHQGPGVSHSRLELFRRRRRKYAAIHVHKTMSPDEPTDAMRLGTLVDLLVLTPERWNEVVAPDAPKDAPDGKKWLRRKGSDHERWWREYEAGLKESGLMVIEREEREKARAMREAVFQSEAANGLLLKTAQSLRQYIVGPWTDEETGIECRAMLDDWHPWRPLAVDLKTCKDASPRVFSSQAAALGYFRQAAWYQWGIHETTGEVPPFVFVCVANTPPHEVACYEPDEADLEDAHKENRADLNALAKCLETGDWREPWERQINVLPLPRWKRYEHEWNLTPESEA